MNLEGIAVKLLLEEPDQDRALQIYSELKSDYFSTHTYQLIFNHIKTFYEKHNHLPTFFDIKTYKSRDIAVLGMLDTIATIDTHGADLDLVIEELANHHAQTKTLDLIDNVLDKISLYDRYDLLAKLAEVPLRLEELLNKSNLVFTVKDIDIFESKEATAVSQVISGISDEWDTQMGGYYKQDLVLYGGKRGSGKSIVCANLVANQHRQGLPSIYFTIEMTAAETLKRIIGILAGVSSANLKKNTLTEEETSNIARTLASLYEGGLDLYEAHFGPDGDKDPLKLQKELRSLPEKDKGRIIIVDDKDLSIPTIDNKVATWKARYGDSLGLVVVDYINQVTMGVTEGMYDWKDQIIVSKSLKVLARKHDVCIVSPYQIDADGKARFAQGILDAPDTAQLIKIDDKESGHILFENTKMRSGEDGGKYKVSISWSTLGIDPRAVPMDEFKEEEKEPVSSKGSKKIMDLEL